MHIRQYLTFTLAGTLMLAPLQAFAQSVPAPAATGVPSTTDAQPHRGAGMRRLLQTLDLTTDQKARIKTYMQTYRQSRDTATPETRAQLRAQIEGVLTPEQRAKFAAATAQAHRAQREGAEAAPSPTPTPTS